MFSLSIFFEMKSVVEKDLHYIMFIYELNS